MEQFNIDTEYERIYGTSCYPTLYNLQNEEYIQFRRQIIGAVSVPYLSSKLPFEDICDTCDNSNIPKSTCGEAIKQISTCDHLSHCCNVMTDIRNHAVNLLMGILSSLI